VARTAIDLLKFQIIYETGRKGKTAIQFLFITMAVRTSNPTRSSINLIWIYTLYSLSNIIRVIKSRKMSLAGYVACMDATKNADKSYRTQTTDNLQKQRMKVWTEFNWLMMKFQCQAFKNTVMNSCVPLKKIRIMRRKETRTD
jgi:hypothetical protein